MGPGVTGQFNPVGVGQRGVVEECRYSISMARLKCPQTLGRLVEEPLRSQKPLTCLMLNLLGLCECHLGDSRLPTKGKLCDAPGPLAHSTS